MRYTVAPFNTVFKHCFLNTVLKCSLHRSALLINFVVNARFFLLLIHTLTPIQFPGTVAILHSLLNNKERIVVGDLLSKFATDCESADPLSRANLLAENEDIAGKHATAANQGQTAAPNADDKINLHFVAFVSVNGSLYELDGRKDGPVNWGPCPEDELLSCAAEACKEYMSSDPEEYRFTVVALGKDC